MLVTVDGLRLTIDATTGELLDSVEGAVPQGGRGAC